jgi:hypothetical protein
MNIHSLKKILILILLFLSTIFVTQTFAYEARSESNKIDWGNLNSFSGRKTSENYYLVDSGGQLGIDVYTSENYIVYAGFAYYYSLIPFTFTIDSQSSFNFASLQPNTPQTATTDLTVTSGAAHGYVVTVYEEYPLRLGDDPTNYIPDVTGDNGDITDEQEGMWNQNTTHGFGYTLSNLVGSDAVFTNGYKQFADISNSEDPQTIIENSGITRESSVRVEYKLNVGSEQKSGFYNTKINYRCTGTF